MEIEILTTKRKLTKGILNQLHKVSLLDMEQFNSTDKCGYYINDNNSKIFLVETHNGWRKLKEIDSDTIRLYSTHTSYVAIGAMKIYNKFVKRCKNHLII